MQSHFIIGRIALSGALLLADGAAIAADKNNFAAPTKSDNIAAICVRDASGYHLDAGRLANWYFIKYPDVAQAFQSADQLRAALAQDPSAINPANRGGNDPNQPMVSAILGGMSYLPAGGLFTFGKVNGQDFNRQQYRPWKIFAGDASLPIISCPPVKPKPVVVAKDGAGDWSGSAWRIRGNSDSLAAVAAPPSAPAGAPVSPQASAQTAATSTAAGATLSISGNIPSKTYASASTAAVGYDFKYESTSPDPGRLYQADLIPFLAVDESLSDVAGKKSSSDRQNVMLGMVGGIVTNPQLIGIGDVSLINTSSGTYQHLWNDIDRSQLNFLHFLYLPTITGGKYWALNGSIFVPSGEIAGKEWFYVTPQLSFIGDLGFYSDRGEKPASNKDYVQLGGQAGLDIVIPKLWSDINVSELYMGETERSRPDIHLFVAAWTLTIPKTNTLGIKTSYQTGYLEATGQRTQQWLVSLSAKY